MARRNAVRAEQDHPTRTVGEVEYFTSQHAYDPDASIVVYRFPCVNQKSAPDVVMVHGIGVSSRSYGPTAAALAERGDVHLIDLPGYGASPRPTRDLGIADHAEVVAAYLEELDLDHPVVVGHSMGTQVVARLAADHPSLLDHLVLISPVLVPGARSLPKVAALLALNGLREPPLVSALAVNDYLFRAGIPYMIRQTPHLLHNDLEATAARVEARTLVVCGDHDPIVPLEWGRELAGRFRHGWFVTVPGPHAAMFASPRAIADLIVEHARR